MKIMVCIKQVPATQKVQVDPISGVLIRDGVEAKMNPYDLYALECAFQIKKQCNATICVITMGPAAAKQILLEAFSLGADEAYLLSDRNFAGADVLATSYTLAQGVKMVKDVDLIICGKQTTDGDTAQVGPAIGEHLNIPHVSWVSELISANEVEIVFKQELNEGVALTKMHYPCLISVEKEIFTPNLPSYKKKVAARNKTITTLTLADLMDKDPSRYGLAGSPTQVERIFEPNNQVEGKRIALDDLSNALEIINKLKELKVIGEDI